MHLRLAAALSLLFAASASATPVYYTNSASFNAAAAGVGATLTTENFNAGPTGSLPQVYGPMTVSQTNFSGSVGSAAYASGNAVIVSTSTGNSLTFTFSSPINAFGLDVYDLGTVGATNLSFQLGAGPQTNVYSGFTGSTGNQQFAGVIDTTPFTSVTIRNSTNGDYLEFDNVRFGASTVPEPSTFALFGVVAGLGLGAYALRRRKFATPAA